MELCYRRSHRRSKPQSTHYLLLLTRDYTRRGRSDGRTRRPFVGAPEESVGWRSRSRRISRQASKDAISDGISRIAAGKGVARSVDDQTQDVAKSDSPRVRDRTEEESSVSASRSQHGAADRHLAHEICFNIDDEMLPHARRGSIVRLRDPESVAQRNPRQHGRAHGSTS